jgi:hypothetical protein
MRRKTDVPCTWCLCQWQAKDPIQVRNMSSSLHIEIRALLPFPATAGAVSITNLSENLLSRKRSAALLLSIHAPQ